MLKDSIVLSESFLKDQFLKSVMVIDVLPTITKQYNNRVHTSTKLSSKDASSKKNERFVYRNLLDKRKRTSPEFRIHDLVRTVDSKKMFSKGDTTNWSYKLYKIREIVNNTKPS